jgi:hypothetical protein
MLEDVQYYYKTKKNVAQISIVYSIIYGWYKIIKHISVLHIQYLFVVGSIAYCESSSAGTVYLL